MKTLFALSLLLSLPCFAGAPTAEKSMPAELGETLKSKGWKEVVRCFNGHEWAYVLSKGQKSRVCKGINARGGSTEKPCEPFSRDVKEFKKAADAAQKYHQAYDEASKRGETEKFLKEGRAIPSCWKAAEN